MAAFGYILVTQAPQAAAGGRRSSPGSFRLAQGDLPGTIPELEVVLQQRPRSGTAWFRIARLYEAADRDEDAKGAWWKAAEHRLRVAERESRNADAWFEAGWAYWKVGEVEKAKDPLERAELLLTELNPESKTEEEWGRLGWARKLLGRDSQESAIAWDRARDIVSRRAIPGGIAGELYNLACYLSLLGDKDKALETLDSAVHAGWRDAGWTAHDDDFGNIKDDPRFTDLIVKMRQAPTVRTESGS